MADPNHNFVRDLVWLIREEIDVSAKELDDFSRGRALALVQVLSLIRAQALAFDIPLVEIGLDELEPGNLLSIARATGKSNA